MFVGAGKATDATDVVDVEEVVMVVEDVVAIRIAPTTSGMVLVPKRFIRISELLIGMPFRGAVKHMLDFNASVEELVADAVTTVHVGAVDVA